MDFYKISERSTTRGREKEVVAIDIYPDFIVKRSSDLMIRGKSFYAVWDDEKGLWSKDEYDVVELVDKELYGYRDALQKNTKMADIPIKVMTMASNRSKTWKEYKQYTSTLADNYHELDEKLTFLNTDVKKEDYVSRRLGYALEEGDCEAWDRLVGVLYDPGEREKIEWAIGAIVSGDSRAIQKFCVFYGAAGTGKSTIINIIQKLFNGYYITFDARALATPNSQFSTEVFRSNPLVAIQHDGDLSRIEDNTKINSIVSHEQMVINEKGKPQYMMRMNCFLFLGTNKPVKITDARSGIIRRLIDITPSGRRLSPSEYEALMNQIDFELGPIAQHCLEVYRELGKNYYKNYIPRDMILKTDVFYNFVEACLDIFEAQEGMTLKQAYGLYKDYCDDALVEFKLPRHKFREELKVYYERFDDVARVDGKQVRSWYSGFKREKMEAPALTRDIPEGGLKFDATESLLDDILADCPAQYATEDESERPLVGWSSCKTKLRDLDTRKVHYILPRFPKPDVEIPSAKEPNLVMMDFDIKNKKGEKDAGLNLAAAAKWPSTYGEFSKGGAGVHLIYWYTGDISKLAAMYAPGIEIKAFPGNSAMRRRLSYCNNLPIATLREGSLPLKEEKGSEVHDIRGQKHLENRIRKALRKEDDVGGTRCEIDLIKKSLEDAYNSGIEYDVSHMEEDIRRFARQASNQSKYCLEVVDTMKFRSQDKEDAVIDISALDAQKRLIFEIRRALKKLDAANDPECQKGHEEAFEIERIRKLLEEAFESGESYNVSDLEHDILLFAMGAKEERNWCVDQVKRMKFKSKEAQALELNVVRKDDEARKNEKIVFFDCEIYPPGIDEDGEDNEGLFLVCWKIDGEDQPVHAMVNPKPHEIEDLVQMLLVGFNNRAYDNHMLYARMLGYGNDRLYDLSRRLIVERASEAKFREAYDISYTDVFDFCSKKQGLKKWEVELGISHMEMGIPWDKPVPKRLWNDVIEYCSNDVRATEAVFHARHEDWLARQILADLADGTVNDTTNSLTLKIIFGDERHPQLVYTDLATGRQEIGR